MSSPNAYFLDGSTWKDSSALLNWNGLMYLYHTVIRKHKKEIHDKDKEEKHKEDDQSIHLSYSDLQYPNNSGTIQVDYNKGNETLYFSPGGTCGGIDTNGMLKILVNEHSSIQPNGAYIDSSGFVYINMKQ